MRDSPARVATDCSNQVLCVPSSEQLCARVSRVDISSQNASRIHTAARAVGGPPCSPSGQRRLEQHYFGARTRRKRLSQP